MADFLSALTSVASALPTRSVSGAMQAGAAQTGVASGVTQGFSDMLAQAASRTVDTLGRAEATSIAALQGKATLQQVVDQVNAAEQSLQTALALRDKAVSAWTEISRMSI